MRIRSVVPGLVILLLQGLAPLPASAQLDQTGLSPASVGISTSNYYFARPNELTIIVSVLGEVGKPGRYEISSTIDLINLLALAGGVTPEGTMGDVRILRTVRMDNSIDRRERRVDLSDLTKVDQADLALHPGDVIRVEKAGWSAIDVINAVGTAALLTTTVLNIIVLSRR